MARLSDHRISRIIRHSLRGLYVISPGNRAFLPPSLAIISRA